MEFIAEFDDFGAPEICATAVQGVERISLGQVRVTYLSKRRDGYVAAVHMVWDFWDWCETWAKLQQARDNIIHDLRYLPTIQKEVN